MLKSNKMNSKKIKRAEGASRSYRRVSRPTRRTRKWGAGSLENRKVAVLMGGVSRERSISLKTGKAVIDALLEEGYDVTRVVVNDHDERVLNDIPSDVKAAFIALHGTFGEDGFVQSLLASREIPYTGAGPAASALAFNKLKCKRRLRRYGLPTPDYVALMHPWTDSHVEYVLDRVKDYPVVIKPACEGSSIGVTLARSRHEAREAIERSRKYRDNLILEQFIAGREMTVPIFRGLQLPIVEMETEQEFFTFFAKYEDNKTRYTVDPFLVPDTYARVLKVAREAHGVIGCDPFSRVDIRLDDNGRPWILEINTIPGLTPTSLFPKAAEAVGISFSKLCSLMVQNAAVRTQSWASPSAHRIRS